MSETSAKLQPASDARRELTRRTRRSFLVGGVAAAAGIGAYEWLKTRTPADGVSWPLRRGLEADERLTQGYFRPARLAREYPLSAAEPLRVNGTIGLDSDNSDWRLSVDGVASGAPQTLTLDAIRALPKADFVTELKCIEGWSRRVRWTGARFADFARQYPGAFGTSGSYAGFETPDREYYVGLDIESAMHPQTLLCYEMDGAPLTDEHGAPLRLTVPIKYGVKSLKRVGRVFYSKTRPADYWAERGYDYYAGF